MTSFGSTTPILRMFDVPATLRFYVDYLGFSVDWQDGEDEGPLYMQVSRGDLVLHLSSHHGDGTPGTAVLIETRGLEELHGELQRTEYRFMNPGIEPSPAGREVVVIDPARNELRFIERLHAA